MSSPNLGLGSVPLNSQLPPAIHRRRFLKLATRRTVAAVAAAEAMLRWSGRAAGDAAAPGRSWRDATGTADWLTRWERNILNDARNRYCDKELAEDLGWRVSPFLEGFYYGYLATGDVRWVDRLTDWADAWIRRAEREPDGFPGWPMREAAGTDVDGLNRFDADSFLGEAMCLRPLVLMAGRMRSDPQLSAKYVGKGAEYLKLSEQIFEKWEARGAWRETGGGGGIWVVLPYGLDRATGRWTDGFATRNAPGHGFSHPNNKANADARWHLAMYDVTGKAIYRERAEKWFRLMKSRLQTREQGRYYVWNYWMPAGPWDYKPDGSPKHWVGVHPNGGYYEVDVIGIAAAYEHGLVFTREEMDRLIATNRDYMWNQQVKGAKFRRIDGEAPAEHWKNTPGMLWTGLLPYDAKLREIFEANHDPASWGGLSATPWYLSSKPS